MRKATPKKTVIRSTPVSPISFRMPPALRARLRRFAKERNLAEAEALRLVVSEHLDQVENERELAAAERWQFKQAYATWQRYLRGEEGVVPWEEIQKIFADARAGRLRRPTE
jgi:predicted DNA-binding protein